MEETVDHPSDSGAPSAEATLLSRISDSTGMSIDDARRVVESVWPAGAYRSFFELKQPVAEATGIDEARVEEALAILMANMIEVREQAKKRAVDEASSLGPFKF